jgi:hypothetical protein
VFDFVWETLLDCKWTDQTSSCRVNPDINMFNVETFPMIETFLNILYMTTLNLKTLWPNGVPVKAYNCGAFCFIAIITEFFYSVFYAFTSY